MDIFLKKERKERGKETKKRKIAKKIEMKERSELQTTGHNIHSLAQGVLAKL